MIKPSQYKICGFSAFNAWLPLHSFSYLLASIISTELCANLTFLPFWELAIAVFLFLNTVIVLNQSIHFPHYNNTYQKHIFCFIKLIKHLLLS